MRLRSRREVRRRAVMRRSAALVASSSHSLSPSTMATTSKFQEQQPYSSYAPPFGDAPKYNPGTSQPYASSAPPQPPYDEGGYDYNKAYEGDRFKPKTRLNDPVFLILFIAQVCILECDWFHVLYPLSTSANWFDQTH